MNGLHGLWGAAP